MKFSGKEMKRDDDNRTLYIGLDESNHGRWPEIIVSVSSLNKTDVNVSKIDRRERMNEEEITRFFNNQRRNWAYTKAERGQLTKGKNPLVEAAPYLVDKLLSTKREYASVDSIDLLFDGELKFGDSDELVYRIRRMKRARRIIAMSYECYPKSTKGAYNYPRILVTADSLAHLLFRKHSFIEKIGADSRMIKLKR